MQLDTPRYSVTINPSLRTSSNSRIALRQEMPNRTIRFFLSSTFRDFGEERDLLIKRVFPALRARLKDLIERQRIIQERGLNDLKL